MIDQQHVRLLWQGLHALHLQRLTDETQQQAGGAVGEAPGPRGVGSKARTGAISSITPPSASHHQAA